MIYTGYSKTDSYYEFVGDGEKLIIPASEVILVDDNSGMITIKTKATRKAIGSLYVPSTPPTPPTPPTPSYDGQYLAFKSLDDNTFTFYNVVYDEQTEEDVTVYPSGVTYSLDNGSTWTELTSGGTPTVHSGDTIMWKSELIADEYAGIGMFASTGQFEVEGNIMSMKYGDNFSGQTELTDDYAFYRLFSGCTGLTSAENLVLPATTLASWCYSNMFNGCTSLTTAPELPATTLANNCYGSMFMGCTSLTTAPALTATTLAIGCYSNMFNGCTSLTTAPVLSATTLSNGCYNSMFKGCTSLVTAPALTATTLAERCYQNMFQGCTSLATAPQLPATTLAERCYYQMFQDCTSLTTSPVLSATTLTKNCYYEMFKSCTNLSSITCLATDISASTCTRNWVRGVASSGTFYKASTMNDWTTGYNGIPSDWTVQDYQG